MKKNNLITSILVAALLQSSIALSNDKSTAEKALEYIYSPINYNGVHANHISRNELFNFLGGIFAGIIEAIMLGPNSPTNHIMPGDFNLVTISSENLDERIKLYEEKLQHLNKTAMSYYTMNDSLNKNKKIKISSKQIIHQITITPSHSTSRSFTMKATDFNAEKITSISNYIRDLSKSADSIEIRINDNFGFSKVTKFVAHGTALYLVSDILHDLNTGYIKHSDVTDIEEVF